MPAFPLNRRSDHPYWLEPGPPSPCSAEPSRHELRGRDGRDGVEDMTCCLGEIMYDGEEKVISCRQAR